MAASNKSMSSSRTESSQNVHERDVQKGWKQKLLTQHKCRQEMLVHAQAEKGNSALSLHLVLALGFTHNLLDILLSILGGLGFSHLLWTNVSINKDSRPRLSFVPLTLPALD